MKKKCIYLLCFIGVIIVFSMYSSDMIVDKDLPQQVTASAPQLGEAMKYPEGLYNWVYEYKEEDLQKYNCFAYAVGEDKEYLEFDEYSSNGLTNHEKEYVEEIVSYLHDKGYADVQLVDGNYIPQDNETLICFRNAYVSPKEIRDFHFMKYQDGYWLHKSGGSAILIYKHHPLDGAWPHEIYTENGWEFSNEFSYNGKIYFMTYK